MPSNLNSEVIRLLALAQEKLCLIYSLSSRDVFEEDYLKGQAAVYYLEMKGQRGQDTWKTSLKYITEIETNLADSLVNEDGSLKEFSLDDYPKLYDSVVNDGLIKHGKALQFTQNLSFKEDIELNRQTEKFAKIETFFPSAKSTLKDNELKVKKATMEFQQALGQLRHLCKTKPSEKADIIKWASLIIAKTDVACRWVVPAKLSQYKEVVADNYFGVNPK